MNLLSLAISSIKEVVFTDFFFAMSSICVILLKYFKVEFGLHHEVLPLKISSYKVESELSCFGMCNSASICICKMFSFSSLQDAFEKRSRGASVEPPVTRPAEPYDPNNESPSDEEEDDDDDIA